MIEEAADSEGYVPSLPAALEPGNQRELIHVLNTVKDAQDPAVQVFLQPWVKALDAAKVGDLEQCLAQAQLYEMTGMEAAALQQLHYIFGRMDQTAPENRTAADRAIANLACDMEDRLLGR